MKITYKVSFIGLVIASMLLTLLNYIKQWENITFNPSPIKEIHVDSNRVIYKNFEELKENSDFIGIIQPLEEFSRRKHENNYTSGGTLEDFYTRTSVRIIKVFKWDIIPNTSTEIIEPISVINIDWENVKISIDNYSELPSDRPSLVFLQENTFGQLWISNAQDSVFSVKKDSTIITNPKNNSYRDEIYNWIIREKMVEE